ncbi:MAG TPA: heavy metal translocating P-type ATPase [Gaiella sp.]|uniref:heavy metal translocating P-type ATPase n=1 Tax=Gaiella sp. TaxID=2663207 RepID=UPI002D7EAC9A|nr:heavy metal translocating P-type ATPase [Gaiella sp.]HET9287848.1 heavy metal translocating P-type ATPase [Gaiella sp.]
MKERVLAVAALAAIVAGGILWLLGEPGWADIVWGAGAAVVLVPLIVDTLRSLLEGDIGVDAIALVAIAWALLLGEQLAAAIVALMMAGGAALEAWAAGRARRELRRLVERAPRVAHRHGASGVEEVPVEELQPGDLVAVRAGEIVPADGVVAAGDAVVDESALTGESLPVTIPTGGEVRSGTTNAGNAFDARVMRPAAESAYAAIVRLVRTAESDRARFTRLADRYAAVFLPFSLAVAGLAWGASGDPKRGLAVMVVATPCPLILAAPIAFVGGLSRAARAGVIVKGAGVLERLGAARTVLLDKTGTLTSGEPAIERIVELGTLPADETLRLAASLDQLSAHVLAESLVHATSARGIALTTPTGVEEEPGRGIAGVVDGRRVAVGSSGWLEKRGYDAVREHARALDDGDGAGRAKVLVGVDGRLEGVIVMADQLRPGAETVAEELRAAGVEHVALVSGDRMEIAREVASTLGIDEVYAEQDPAEKLETVRQARERTDGVVVMVGDGINDAPALALADVGIAMAGRGATVSSETADVVVVVDHAGRIPLSVRVGRRSLAIARQSVVFGLGLSVGAMVVAAFGYLPPVWGALFQEVIDVAVILNALRALRG